MKYTLYTDASASKRRHAYGVTSIATAGIVILNDKEKVIQFRSQKLGAGTNNEGEYLACIAGVNLLKSTLSTVNTKGKLKSRKPPAACTSIRVCVDSQLMYYQLTGTYAIKNVSLKAKAAELKKLLESVTGSLDDVEIVWNNREHPCADLADFASKNVRERSYTVSKCKGKPLTAVLSAVATAREEEAAAKKDKDEAKLSVSNDSAYDFLDSNGEYDEFI